MFIIIAYALFQIEGMLPSKLFDHFIYFIITLLYLFF